MSPTPTASVGVQAFDLKTGKATVALSTGVKEGPRRLAWASMPLPPAFFHVHVCSHYHSFGFYCGIVQVGLVRMLEQEGCVGSHSVCCALMCRGFSTRGFRHVHTHHVAQLRATLNPTVAACAVRIMMPPLCRNDVVLLTPKDHWVDRGDRHLGRLHRRPKDTRDWHRPNWESLQPHLCHLRVWSPPLIVLRRHDTQQHVD